MNPSSNLDELAEKADKKILKNLELIDEAKSLAEAEIERLILKDEMSLKDKIEERLDVISHLKNFPNFILNYFHETNDNLHLLPAFKETIETIFSTFQTLDQNAINSILPIIQIFQEKERLTLSDITESQSIISQASGLWLKSEFAPQLKTKALAEILENILFDIQNIKITHESEKIILPVRNLRVTFVNNIRRSSLLPSEAKIKLLEKISTIHDNLMHRINQLLYEEIQYSQKHKIVLVQYLLEFLNKIK